MTKVIFSPALSAEDRNAVSQFSIDMIAASADASKNPEVTITSTIRLPLRQARVMYDNLSMGKLIRYAAAGREVCAVYHALKKQGLDRDGIIDGMAARITELAADGQRVSKHCVSAEQYARLNVIDVSRNMPNPRDFVKALARNEKVKTIITPVFAVYDSPKVSYDANEPAIHIEIEQ